MDSPEFFTSQDAFGQWLENHAGAKAVWVGYFRKETGQPSLTWSQSVDVALCYGWIDGIRKTIDAQRYKIRFTPRRVGSVWSRVNVDKVKQLTLEGRMKPAGLQAFNERADTHGYSAEDRNVPLTAAYEAELRANGLAWAFLNGLAPSYRRDSIWWVMSAKREETRQKRLGVLIESSAAGLKIPSMRKS